MPTSDPDALTFINEVAASPCSMDELGRRARQVLALQAPSHQDALVLIEWYRRKRATWGAKGAAATTKEPEDGEEAQG